MIDVAVIGAGPAGCVAAAGAASVGLRVRLIERARFPRYKVCGCCLGPATVTALAEAGIDVAASGVPLRRLTIRGWGRSFDRGLEGHFAMSRESLDTKLLCLAQEAGAELLAPRHARVGAVVDGGRRLHLRGVDEPLEARLVLSAAGLGGALDAGRGAGKTGTSAPVGIGLARQDSAVELVEGTVCMVAGQPGYVGMVRLEDGRLNVAASLSRAVVDELGPGRAVDAVLEGGGLARLGWRRGWRGTPTLRRWSRPQTAERILALGDAGGFGEPFTGEGIGWAVSSAARSREAVAELAGHWCSQRARRWATEQRSWRRRAQRGSRLVSELARRPWLGRIALGVVSELPAILDWVAPGALADAASARGRNA